MSRRAPRRFDKEVRRFRTEWLENLSPAVQKTLKKYRETAERMKVFLPEMKALNEMAPPPDSKPSPDVARRAEELTRRMLVAHSKRGRKHGHGA